MTSYAGATYLFRIETMGVNPEKTGRGPVLRLVASQSQWSSA